ncbi:MAG: tetratricopeptide repeat protein [Gammaproteobacteria bacterium]|nr:tetratricopeptide repeat protein [Gammaproteobacteria bacterium]
MNDSSIANLAERAHACLISNQFDEAKSLYSELCNLDNNNEEYWLTLAALNGEVGEIDEALKCANKAIELDDSYVEAYLTKAHLQQRTGQNVAAFDSALKAVERDVEYEEALLFITGLAGQLKRFNEAEHWGEKTIALMPTSVDALVNLGNAKYALGKYQEAEDTYKKALGRDAFNQEATVGLAKSVSTQERNEEALSILQPLLTSAPENYHAKDAYAACLINLGRNDEAFELLVNIIKDHPDYVFSYKHIADILERQGDYAQAITYLRQALDNTNAPLEVLGELASLYSEYGMPKQAIECCNRALDIDPGNEVAQFFKVISLASAARYEDALEELDLLSADVPDDAKILGTKANIFEKMGRYEEAHQIVRSSIVNGRVPATVVNVFGRLCHKFNECEEAIASINEALERTDLGASYRRDVLFTLGRLHDRLHNYQSAFEAIQKANDLRPCVYDHARNTEYINQLISPEITTLAKQSREIDTSNHIRPVFIVGMPRSGTSLVEQIIASHPQVWAGDERHEIPSLVKKLPSMEGIGGTYPECLTRLTPDKIKQTLVAFEEFTKNIPAGISILTDKMPQNFHHVVFIRMLFPDARIIHCVRNPMDTCLSIYFQAFAGYHDYAYNLEDLGKYYSDYKRLMNHYRDVDKIPFLEVEYEDLVRNTEEVSRRMIDYCGLEWDEQCLRYYDSDRVVRTASYDQVNKPIYTSSIDKWKHYESYLEPLRSALSLDE